MARINAIHKVLWQSIDLDVEKIFDTLLPVCEFGEFKIDGEKKNPYFLAISLGRKSMAIKLLENGCPIQECTEGNEVSSFMLAISNGFSGIALEMIVKGANINDVVKNGIWEENNALLLALVKRMPKVAVALIEKGCDVDWISWIETNALMHASCCGYKEIVLMLLQKGCKINEKDCEGENALFWALHNGKSEITRILIEWGIDLNLEALVYNALSCAIESCPEAVKFLIEAGCKIKLQNADEQIVKNLMSTLKINAKMTYDTLLSEGYVYEDFPKELIPFLFRKDAIPNIRKRKLNED